MLENTEGTIKCVSFIALFHIINIDLESDV
jgi:hypothetical protein